MVMDNLSLVEQDLDNWIDNLSRSSLEGAAVNWMMKYDG